MTKKVRQWVPSGLQQESNNERTNKQPSKGASERANAARARKGRRAQGRRDGTNERTNERESDRTIERKKERTNAARAREGGSERTNERGASKGGRANERANPNERRASEQASKQGWERTPPRVSAARPVSQWSSGSVKADRAWPWQGGDKRARTPQSARTDAGRHKRWLVSLGSLRYPVTRVLTYLTYARRVTPCHPRSAHAHPPVDQRSAQTHRGQWPLRACVCVCGRLIISHRTHAHALRAPRSALGAWGSAHRCRGVQ